MLFQTCMTFRSTKEMFGSPFTFAVKPKVLLLCFPRKCHMGLERHEELVKPIETLLLQNLIFTKNKLYLNNYL